MKALGKYDELLQMFVEEPREPSLAHLQFLRWLGENDLLEHKIAGLPAGRLAPVDGSGVPVEGSLPIASFLPRGPEGRPALTLRERDH